MYKQLAGGAVVAGLFLSSCTSENGVEAGKNVAIEPTTKVDSASTAVIGRVVLPECVIPGKMGMVIVPPLTDPNTVALADAVLGEIPGTGNVYFSVPARCSTDVDVGDEVKVTGAFSAATISNGTVGVNLTPSPNQVGNCAVVAVPAGSVDTKPQVFPNAIVACPVPAAVLS